MNNRGDKLKYVYWFLRMVGALIGVVIYAKTSGILDSMTSTEEFQKYIKGFGTEAHICFFVI